MKISLAVRSTLAIGLGIMVFASCTPAEVNTGSGARFLLGSSTAPVKIVEFGDFQCPGCKFFHDSILPEIKAEYISTGKVEFEYKDFPVHATAPIAHNAAHCAAAQGKAEEYMDQLYANIDAQTIADLKIYADKVGLDKDMFGKCVDSNEFAGTVKANQNEGISKGVSGTPTVFVNGVVVPSISDADILKKAVDQALGQ
ncbi:MAG: DsbA family protein [Candidatus Gracilibacteria bacterium]